MRRIYILLAMLLLSCAVGHAQASIPNLPVQGNITAATTNASCAPIVQGNGAVDQQINSSTNAVGISITGTWTATLNIQLSIDHGKTWTASGGTVSANQQSVLPTGGYSDVCVFASAYTSGTAVVQFATSSASLSAGGTGASANQVQGTAANGSATSGNPVLVAGQDTTGNTRTLACGQPVGTTCTLALGSQQSNSDGIANAFGGYFVTANGLNWVPLMFPQYFNGSTWDREVKCPTAVAIVVAAAGTQQVVAPVAGQKVRVCGLYLTVSTAGTLSITEGTGATCGTGTTTIFGQTVNLPTGGYPIISSPTSVMQTNVSGDGLCITSGTAAVQGWAQVEQH